jgi:integrase
VNRSPAGRVFLNRCGHPITRFGIYALVERYVRRIQPQMPSLASKRVSPHSIRHTALSRNL